MRYKNDEMYDFNLISPTRAEKLMAANAPRKWTKMRKCITQTGGKPSVAHASDKRPALSIAVVDSFEDLDANDLI